MRKRLAWSVRTGSAPHRLDALRVPAHADERQGRDRTDQTADGLNAEIPREEWADRFAEFIPEQARWILFEIKSENQRAITFQGA